MKYLIIIPFKYGRYLKARFKGKSMFDYSIERIEQIFDNEKIILSASKDRKTEEFLQNVSFKNNKTKIVFDDPDNLTNRLYNSVKDEEVEFIVRININQLLLNEVIIRRMIDFFIENYNTCEYLYQNDLPDTFGCDIIKKNTLEKIRYKFLAYSKENIIKLRGIKIKRFGIENVEELSEWKSDLLINNYYDYYINKYIVENKNYKDNSNDLKYISKLLTKAKNNFNLGIGLSKAEKEIIRRKYAFPNIITFEPISTCILDCEFCMLKELETWKYRRKTVMDFKDFKKLVDDTAFFLKQLNFSGGEPLLNKDVFKMFAYARKRGIFTYLFSNSQLLSRDNGIQKIIDNPPDQICIAFDALEKDVYETTRRKGDFDKLKENIVKLIDMKKKSGNKYPIIELQMVLTKKTLKMEKDYWKITKELGADIAQIKPLGVWPEGSASYDKKMIEEYIVTKKEHKNSRHDLDKDGNIIFYRKPGNCACVNISYIGSGGEVLPCWYIWGKDADVMGNINDNSFIDIWDSERYREYRDVMLNGWANKNCHRCIGVMKSEIRKL